MHNEHEINPRQRRKNQRGERHCIAWCLEPRKSVFYFLGGDATFFCPFRKTRVVTRVPVFQTKVA